MSMTTKQKLDIFFLYKIDCVKKKKLAVDFGVTKDEVKDIVKEIQDFFDGLSKGFLLTYNGELVSVESVDNPVEDNLPIQLRFSDVLSPTWDGFDYVKLFDENTKGAEDTVDTNLGLGSRVTLSPNSEYYDVSGKDSSNPTDQVGVITELEEDDSYPFDFYVTWENGLCNSYKTGDLVAAADTPVVVEDSADYFVVAPQDSITIVRIPPLGELETRNINKHNEGFCDIRAMIVADQSKETLSKAFVLMDIKGLIKEFSVGRVKVDPEGETVVLVKQDGSERKVPEDLAQDIIGTIKTHGKEEGERLIKFLDNLMENSSFKAIEGLYRFMKHNSIEINPDGSIAAWKGVMDNLYSSHGGSIKSSSTITVNELGQVYNGHFGKEIRVDRSEVDDDPDSTCSHGLHVGSREYASGWAPTLISVKVWPEDVVAVPKDYEGQKMRTCGYTPLGYPRG